jgi:hypothetical protein
MRRPRLVPGEEYYPEGGLSLCNDSVFRSLGFSGTSVSSVRVEEY